MQEIEAELGPRAWPAGRPLPRIQLACFSFLLQLEKEVCNQTARSVNQRSPTHLEPSGFYSQ
jgi:hypothetical protein